MSNSDIKEPHFEYWDTRYKRGDSSGFGSVGKLREFKWDIINKYAGNVNEVIDVGCGDLSFWEGRNCSKYSGIDISPTIIDRNKKIRKNWKFICSPADVKIDISSNIVLCLDVLFHIMDDDIYLKILNNLMSYSNNLVFIYTWKINPFLNINHLKNRFINLLLKENELNDKRLVKIKYQKYRKFSNYFLFFEQNGFELISIENDNSLDKIGAMYIFQKKSDKT